MKSRPVLAMLICLALFLVWSSFNARRRAEQERERQEQAPPAVVEPREDAREPEDRAVQRAEPRGEESPAPVGVERPRRPDRRHDLVRDEHLVVEVSAKGLRRVLLPEFKGKYDPSQELTLLPRLENRPQPLTLAIEKIRGTTESPEPFAAIELENWELEMDGSAATFRNEVDETGGTGDGQGLEITRSVRPVPDTRYHLELVVTLLNRGDEIRTVQYSLWGPGGLTSESYRAPGRDLRVVVGQHAANGPPVVTLTAASDVAESGRWEQTVRPCYAGVENNYFSAIVAAVTPEGAPAQILDKVFARAFPDPQFLPILAEETYPGRRLEDLSPPERQKLEEEAYSTAQVGLRSRPVELDPGASVSHRFIVYLGPREDAFLSTFPALNLSASNDYGWTDWLVKLFLTILQGFHAITRSWGFSIVCLTLVVRFCLHPINRKQQIGMSKYQKKMAKVQPLIKEIQKKYEGGGDRMKMHQEMQKLFKEHDISHGQMMGGCLMILLQLPVWIGLINTLDYSIDLRQAPFLWWISDLSQPDRFYAFGSTMRFVPEHLNLLPIVYVLLMLVQQKLQPKAADPQAQQTQRMMSFMMIAFGFIFYSFPSGLMVYFITSALFGLCESRIIRRKIAREEEQAGGAPAATTGDGGAPASGPLYASTKLGPRRKQARAEKQKQRQRQKRAL